MNRWLTHRWAAQALYTLTALIAARYTYLFFTEPSLLHPENLSYVLFYRGDASFASKLLDVCAVDSCLLRVRPLGHFFEWLDSTVGTWFFVNSGWYRSFVTFFAFIWACLGLRRIFNQGSFKDHPALATFLAFIPLAWNPVLIQSQIFFRPGKIVVVAVFLELLSRVRVNSRWICFAVLLPLIDELGWPSLLLVIASSSLELKKDYKRILSLLVGAFGVWILSRALIPVFTSGTIVNYDSGFASLHIRNFTKTFKYLFDIALLSFGMHGLQIWTGLVAGFWLSSRFFKQPDFLRRLFTLAVLFGVYFLMLQRHQPMAWSDVMMSAYYSFWGMILIFWLLLSRSKGPALTFLTVLACLSPLLHYVGYSKQRSQAFSGHLAQGYEQSLKLHKIYKGESNTQLDESYRQFSLTRKQ